MPRPRRQQFNPRLAEYRRRLGLTQDEVAERLVRLAREHDGQALAITGHQVGRHERGVVCPSVVYHRQYERLFQASSEQLGLRPVTGLANLTDTGADSSADERVDGTVQRRDMLRLGTAATMTLFGGEPPAGHPLSSVARALTTYSLGEALAPIELSAVAAAVKRSYQACRYQSTLDALPTAIAAVRAACGSATGDELLGAYTAAADVYQVAASVLLKFDDAGLATVAADRSMEMAARSQSPVAIGASARAVTHALTSAGHPARAVEVSFQAAAALDHDVDRHDDDSLSVFGALVLLGALAAAGAGDRVAAQQLLEEADGAAQRLGHDDNVHWTAFGPTNVTLHRMNVARGTAIHALEVLRDDGLVRTVQGRGTFVVGRKS